MNEPETRRDFTGNGCVREGGTYKVGTVKNPMRVPRAARLRVVRLGDPGKESEVEVVKAAKHLRVGNRFAIGAWWLVGEPMS